MITRLFFLFIISFISIQEASSQLFQRKRSRIGEHPPQVMLVEIETHTRKQQYYSSRGFSEKQMQLLKDIDSVRSRMIMDFSDNFTYCPVYYFIDTNRSKVLAGMFEGVLLDSNLRPANNINLQPSDRYQIVYFGYAISSPEPQSQTGKQDPYDSGDVVTRSNRQRLVVLDKNGHAVKKPLPNGSNSKNDGTLKRDAGVYRYKSPMFDIYYVPYARFLSQKLYAFYGRYPYNMQ